MAVSSSTFELVALDETLWEISAETRPDMRVPARIFADRELLDAIVGDQSLEQLQNVATLPGIVGAALAMPDIHQGYGFPVGGVAAIGGPYDRVLVDVRLFDLPTVVFEAGTRDESIRIRPSQLLSAADAEPADLACDRPEELPETAHHDRGVREG